MKQLHLFPGGQTWPNLVTEMRKLKMAMLVCRSFRPLLQSRLKCLNNFWKDCHDIWNKHSCSSEKES